MKKYELKLKDLYTISSTTPDHTGIMKEMGYKNYLWNRSPRFTKYFIAARGIIMEGRNVDPKTVEVNPDCTIKKPESIDNITFKAMMELKAVAGTAIDDTNMVNTIGKIIAIACYKTNHEGVYDSNTKRFKAFEQRVLNSPLWDMFGLYNWTYKALKESNILWEKRFMSVKVDDNDYDEAGGHRMNQFNIITTLKDICNDFNYSYSEAWQVSYSLTQMNSYAKATQNHIGDTMREIKERNMRRERKKNG